MTSSPDAASEAELPTDPNWLRFKAQLERQLSFEAAAIELGGRRLTWLRVANPEVLLERAVAGDGDRSAEEIDPFWAATWRAALGLDRFLAGCELAGQRVLELGCGSGQAGTGAALRGARVTFTDSVEFALEVAKLNFWAAMGTGLADADQFVRLTWGSQILPQPKFPIIIGSDLVYDPSHFERLIGCARQHLAEAGRLFLSEPHRHSGDAFSRWIAEAGWDMIEHDIDLQDGRVPVRIFECQPRD